MRVLVALLLTLSAVSVASAELSRDTLRNVVRSCVLAKRTIGISFPCREVELGGNGAPGYVILQPPLAKSHMVVSPTADIAGIEHPDLRGPDGRVYWQAALRSRAQSAAAFDGRVPLNDIGVAVNSPGNRTQDHLHLHIDCVQPRVLTSLHVHARELTGAWSVFPRSFDGQHFFARRFETTDAFNPFAEAASLPGHPALGTVALALLSAPGAPDGAFVLMAAVGPYAQAEGLLDHSCRIADGTRTRF